MVCVVDVMYTMRVSVILTFQTLDSFSYGCHRSILQRVPGEIPRSIPV